MGIITDIEWCDSVLNLQMGCDGCELWNPAANIFRCYAGALTGRYAGRNKGFPEAFDKPALFLSRIDEAIRWPDLTGTARPDKPWLDGLPRIIFLDDMGDTFTESLPVDWLLQPYGPLVCPKGHRPPRVQRMPDGQIVCSARGCCISWAAKSPLQIMAETPHQYLMLTKRPARMAELSEMFPLPTNVWPGTTITGPANKSRLNDLAAVAGGGPAFVSYEPIVSGVDVLGPFIEAGIRWAIFGGESDQIKQPARPCDLEVLRHSLNMAEAAGAKRFVKQLGSRIRTGFSEGHELGWKFIDDRPGGGWCDWKPKDGKGGDWHNWPDDLCIREMPKIGVAA